MENEIWKPVKGYERIYEVSNIGNVRSLDKIIVKTNGIKQFRKGKILSLSNSTDGYLQCKLCSEGKYKTIGVHRIVAEAFIPNPDSLPEVNHIDCDRKNNNVRNLEWMDHISNVRYSSFKGHYKHYGNKNSNYKNDTLKNFYKEHPEKAVELLRRPGAQNGRAVPIKAIFPNGKELTFSFIGECAKFLIENNYTNSQINCIRDRITQSIKNGKTYKNIKFEKL